MIVGAKLPPQLPVVKGNIIKIPKIRSAGLARGFVREINAVA